MATINLSKPTKVDLKVYKGDSGSFRITLIPEVPEEVIDLDGVTWDGDIRSEASAPDVIASFTITPVDGDPASVDVYLSAEDSELLPSSCVYDIEMRRDGEVSTLVCGEITVTQDVSRP